MPERKGLKPAYEQFKYDDAELRNKLALVAGPDATVTIRQDVNLYITRLDGGKEVKHALESGRHAWVQIARGAVSVNGKELKAGDGAAISDEADVRIEALKPSEVLLFDLA
jgi:redox-sensitive bicupin YhaK (pirin superfamily)